jgi:hypothetical protein
MKSICVAIMALILGGCASGYNQFYTRIPGATPEVIAGTRASPAPVEPRLERTDQSPQVVNEAYGRHGYAAIGYSAFTSGHNESEASAVKQGAAVGADLVVVMSPKYAGSVTTSIPITTPTSRTSYTSGSATAYGSGGSVTAYGNSRTTTYGSQTTYMPLTINRQEFGAIYFVKTKYLLGASVRDLTTEERQQIQSNSGLYVTNVIDESPAFTSNLLVGDIILAIDGRPSVTQTRFGELIRSLRGRTVDLFVNRRGESVHLSVRLPQ